ncbi:hypothetical protein GOV10_02855 [Candidatus Woesearchaeota archaeon]|nr:hypothetical protein [Candidatus Woesearchaeota archaeon]
MRLYNVEDRAQMLHSVADMVDETTKPEHVFLEQTGLFLGHLSYHLENVERGKNDFVAITIDDYDLLSEMGYLTPETEGLKLAEIGFMAGILHGYSSNVRRELNIPVRGGDIIARQLHELATVYSAYILNHKENTPKNSIEVIE